MMGRHIRLTLSIVFLIAYIVLFAPSFGRELIVTQQWLTAVPESDGPQAAAPQSVGQANRGANLEVAVTPFRLGNRFGFVNGAGTILYSGTAEYGVALADQEFSNYSQNPDAIVVMNASGVITRTLPGNRYPAFVGNRLYLFGSDQQSVSSYGSHGESQWTREFSSIITAIAGNSTMTVLGLMNGHVVLLSPEGRLYADLVPGSSSVPAAYAVAVTDSGRWVAAVTGLNPQYLHVYSVVGGNPTEVAAQKLSSDFRGPVLLRFVRNVTNAGSGKNILSAGSLVVEADRGIGIYDQQARMFSTVPLSFTPSRIAASSVDGLIVVGGVSAETNRESGTGGSSPSDRVAFVLPDGRRVFEIEFAGRDLYIGMPNSPGAGRAPSQTGAIGNLILGADGELFGLRLDNG